MELDLGDPAVLRDPFTAYRRAPVLRLGPMWVLTRYEQARAMLGDPRFEINVGSFRPPEVPSHCRPYLRTMTERPGPEHARLRRLVTPAFSARRAEEFRPVCPGELHQGGARGLWHEWVAELLKVVLDGLSGACRVRRRGGAAEIGHGRELGQHGREDDVELGVVCSLVGVAVDEALGGLGARVSRR